MIKNAEERIKTQSLDMTNKDLGDLKMSTMQQDDFLGQQLREYNKNTFVHSIKTRDIVFNGYGMERPRSKAFVPVNRSEAKNSIFRPTIHIEELHDIKKINKKQ